jgi:predicted nuclease of restriction endonuclease-like RecB superfamily
LETRLLKNIAKYFAGLPSKKVWHIVAEVNKNAGYIATLKHFIKDTNQKNQ